MVKLTEIEDAEVLLEGKCNEEKDLIGNDFCVKFQLEMDSSILKFYKSSQSDKSVELRKKIKKLIKDELDFEITFETWKLGSINFRVLFFTKTGDVLAQFRKIRIINVACVKEIISI